ncbi:hypothetical protein [Variovorax sp. Root434]|uniref:hypothetical protein n=1 Tax=Variovorax sp. Root434 TaxID=1736536 RepID=UPI000B0D2F7A|nr:hypothetical protein [Variovorax sp. Root434]
MAAKYILAAFAVAFLVAAALRRAKVRTLRDPAIRTWLFIALVFTAIAALLQRHTS